MTQEIFFSIDVESNGSIPGPHSMLSIGAAAFLEDNEVPIATFYANLLPLPGSNPDANTEAWWNEPSQARAKAALMVDRLEPKIAMEKFVSWVNTISHQYSPVFVGYPAGFDFLFVYWYIKYFQLSSPFSFSALDIKTFAMATMGGKYRNATKKNMPKRWFSDKPHTHIAVDDAIEQGILFLRMKQDNNKLRK